MRRIWVMALVILLGLSVGLSLGLTYAWLIDPVEYTDTEIADLKEVHQTDYVLMVSDAYALTGDLDVAREHLSRLGVPDMATLVLSHAQAALSAGVSEGEVSRLARLAAELGASDPILTPYLTPSPTVP
jgi:hypothetical protein